MALFDFLKKASSVATELAKAAEKAGKEVADAVNDTAKSGAEAAKNAAQSAAGAMEESAARENTDEWAMYADTDLSPEEMTAHFDRVIAANFAGQYEKDYAASRLDPTAHPACKSVSYMFMENGAPALAVVLVSRKNYRGMNVIGTKEIVDKKRIPYMRFFVEMQNREDYVVSRIKAAL